MTKNAKAHPMDVARHLDCGRKLTPILCGWSCGCGAVFVDYEHNGIRARVAIAVAVVGGERAAANA